MTIDGSMDRGGARSPDNTRATTVTPDFSKLPPEAEARWNNPDLTSDEDKKLWAENRTFEFGPGGGQFIILSDGTKVPQTEAQQAQHGRFQKLRTDFGIPPGLSADIIGSTTQDPPHPSQADQEAIRAIREQFEREYPIPIPGSRQRSKMDGTDAIVASFFEQDRTTGAPKIVEMRKRYADGDIYQQRGGGGVRWKSSEGRWEPEIPAPRPGPRPAASPGTPLTEHERRIQSEREQTELARAQAERARAEADRARAEKERNDALASLNTAAARAAADGVADTPRPASIAEPLRRVEQILQDRRKELKLFRYFLSSDFLKTAGSCAALGAGISIFSVSVLGFGGLGLAAFTGGAVGIARTYFERRHARNILNTEIAKPGISHDKKTKLQAELAKIDALDRENVAHGLKNVILGTLFAGTGYSVSEYFGLRDLIAQNLPFLAGVTTGGAATKAAAAMPTPGGGGGIIPGAVQPPGAPRNLPPGIVQGPRAPRPPVCVWETHCQGVRMRGVPQEVLQQRFRGGRPPHYLQEYVCRRRVMTVSRFGPPIYEVWHPRGPRTSIPFMFEGAVGRRSGNGIVFVDQTVRSCIRGPRAYVISEYYMDCLNNRNINSRRAWGIEPPRRMVGVNEWGGYRRVNLQRFFCDDGVLREMLSRPRLRVAEQQNICRIYYEANASLRRRPPGCVIIEDMWRRSGSRRWNTFNPAQFWERISQR